MNHDVEETGPLTPEQHEEMLRHPLKGMEYHDLEEDIKYYERVLGTTPEGDPVYQNFTRQLELTRRYLALKRRFDIDGVSTVMDLTKVFDKD